jgi:hypothetical protein
MPCTKLRRSILEFTNDDSPECGSVTSFTTRSPRADDLINGAPRSIASSIFLTLLQYVVDHDAEENVIGPAEVKRVTEALGGRRRHHGLKGPTGMPVNERYTACEMLWKVPIARSGLVLRSAAGASH